MSRVSLEAVGKSYGAVTVLKPLDLDIADGEFLVLLGPSGCGKSTTMRMIAGLEAITTGTLRFDGRDVTALHPRDRNVAMVFQNYALYPHMTVADNIGYPLKVARVGRAERLAQIEAAARKVDLTPFLARGSGWRWRGHWCVRPGCSCWTNRCRTWTPSCASRCGPRSSIFSAVWA